MFTQKTLRACVIVLKQFHDFDWVILEFSICAKFNAARNVFWVNIGAFKLIEKWKLIHSNLDYPDLDYIWTFQLTRLACLVQFS